MAKFLQQIIEDFFTPYTSKICQLIRINDKIIHTVEQVCCA